MSWINEVRRMYDEPHRHYHTWNHIRYCLDLLLDLNEKIRLTDWMCLRYALAYHDCIYDPQSKWNEEESATFAELDLHTKGATEDDRKEVARLILLTKHHDPAPGDTIGEIMCDIDCAILGESRQEYLDYVEGVRLEYDWVSDEDWKTGRSAFLNGLLTRPRIFRSSYFTHLEQPARDNIEAELESLQ